MEMIMTEFDKPIVYEFRGKTYVVYHGDPFDRGSADSYYHRGAFPHRGGVGGNSGEYSENLTEREIAEYMAGYEYNEFFGDKKDWG
jgi:hypothetical protein